jgi:hypothetical protein
VKRQEVGETRGGQKGLSKKEGIVRVQRALYLASTNYHRIAALLLFASPPISVACGGGGARTLNTPQHAHAQELFSSFSSICYLGKTGFYTEKVRP